ncbi:NAD(P)-dependent oxidoreductase [Luminiphilus sp.]|nr:NAD(P)-dependent oxidoreductase [Luminiphilus sp.]
MPEKWLIVGWTEGAKKLAERLNRRGVAVQTISTRKFMSAQSESLTFQNFIIFSAFFRYDPKNQQDALALFSNKLRRQLSDGDRKAIFLSSASVYGLSDNASVAYRETDELAPIDLNGLEKKELEGLFAELASLGLISSVVFRAPGLIGKLDGFNRSFGFIDHLISIKHSGLPSNVILESQGQQYRDFLHVDDLFEIIEQAAIDFERFCPRQYHIYNLSNREKLLISDIYDKIIGVDNALVSASLSSSDTAMIHSSLDNRLISSLLPNFEFISTESYLEKEIG